MPGRARGFPVQRARRAAPPPRARTAPSASPTSHLAGLGFLARPGEFYGGPVAGYRVLAIGERFAGYGRLKLGYGTFAAQIDCHVVGEEIDRDDAIVLAAIGVASFDRWRQRLLQIGRAHV